MSSNSGPSHANADHNKKKNRVELHVHLDGAVRPSTIFELAGKKGIKLPGASVEDLKAAVEMREFGNLQKFLDSFSVFMPVISGDPEAIQRIAYEFCEDCSHQRLLYVEARYCPHLLRESSDTEKKPLSAQEVVSLVNEGFMKGQNEFGVKVRSILCCMRHMTEWSTEVLELCLRFKNDGVVGIDIAGNEQLCDESTHAGHVKVFQEAAKLGICRTVHAGENGPAGLVREAIEEMHAQRIGHGYHSIDDPDVYKLVRERNIHLEVCPYSSYATGSFSGIFKEHPVRRFLLDNVNFSINTDDPLVTGHTLNDEYELCKKEIDMTDGDLAHINLNAAKSCFLPPDEKQELVHQLQRVYGLID